MAALGHIARGLAVPLGARVLAVVFVLGREGDVNRGQDAENEHLDDAYECAEQLQDRARQEQRDHAERDRDEA